MQQPVGTHQKADRRRTQTVQEALAGTRATKKPSAGGESKERRVPPPLQEQGAHPGTVERPQAVHVKMTSRQDCAALSAAAGHAEEERASLALLSLVAGREDVQASDCTQNHSPATNKEGPPSAALGNAASALAEVTLVPPPQGRRERENSTEEAIERIRRKMSAVMQLRKLHGLLTVQQLEPTRWPERLQHMERHLAVCRVRRELREDYLDVATDLLRCSPWIDSLALVCNRAGRMSRRRRANKTTNEDTERISVHLDLVRVLQRMYRSLHFDPSLREQHGRDVIGRVRRQLEMCFLDLVKTLVELSSPETDGVTAQVLFPGSFDKPSGQASGDESF